MSEETNVEEIKEKKTKKVKLEEEIEITEEETEKEPELSELEEAKQYKEKFYYLAAEMDNAKKRFEREKTNLIKFGLEGTLKDLVEVVDNFERTLDAISKDEDDKIKNIASGIEMVRNQFLDVLKKQGLEAIDTKDKEFDPNFHEAMAQQEVEGKKEGLIIEDFQRGYVLNGRLLRAAKVIVSK